MRVLLDTHAFLWFILDDPKLSTLARGIIEEEKYGYLSREISELQKRVIGFKNTIEANPY